MKNLILTSILVLSGMASAEIKPSGYIYQKECSQNIEYTNDAQRQRDLEIVCTATINGDETKSEYLTTTETWSEAGETKWGAFVWRINHSEAARSTGRIAVVNMEVQWVGWINEQNLFIPLRNEELKSLSIHKVVALYRLNQAGGVDLLSLSADDFNTMNFKATQFEPVLHSMSNTKTL